MAETQKDPFEYVDVVTARLESGDNISYLVNKKTAEIMDFTFLYALERRIEVTSATLKNCMHSLIYLYEESLQSGFPLDKYLAGMLQYDQQEFENLVSNLFVYMQSGRSQNNLAGTIYSRLEASSFSVYWSNIETFLSHWFRKRMASIQDFDEFNMAEKRLNALAGRFRALSLTAPREQQLKLLSAEDLASVVAAFNPDTSVFSSEAVCWRNWTMFLVLLDTGIRKGALMGLRLEDLPIAPSTLLKIVRRPDAVEDPRNDRPQVKTYSRSVTLSKTSIKAIHTYIEKYRPDHACSPYIFLNDSGDGPLSLQGLDSAFLKVSTFIDIHTTPHKLRHTRHYNRLIDLARAGEENFMEIVRVEGGWAPRNEYTGRGGIPDTYKRQFLIDMANNTAPLFLDKILSTAMKAEVPGGK